VNSQDWQRWAQSSGSFSGARLGPYRLLSRIGEGGMGVVYLAERDDELRRRVAIKLMRSALANAEALARFHTERRTLAALSHPNIVTLLDGGATPEGAPYLVMEYVDGLRLTEYCRQYNPGVRERLELFLQIASAIEYAHRNLVVHCDLKPGNVLVTAEGAVKLLDFGIAKLLGPSAGQLTQAGPRPFTPDYASPEQVRGEPVTTATDVYGLGLILYELLAGGPPYRFETQSAAAILAAVCVRDPEPPSARNARLDPDLDAIVLKALRKEPQERYASAAHMAEDVRRYLGGRPVSARKGTLRYRAAKFIRRNKVAAAAAALALLATSAGVGGVLWQAGLAQAARLRAERRFQEVRKLTRFLLFDFHDAVEKLPGSTPIRQMLVERALAYLDSLAAEAGGDAELQLELAEAYIRFGDVQGNPYQPNLGDATGALASYRKALQLAEPPTRADPANLRAARALARVHAHTGDVLFLLRRMREATAETRRAVAILENATARAPREVETRMELASTLEGLGDQFGQGLSDRVAALECFRKSLAHWQEAARLDPNNLRARRAMAGLNMKIGEAEAEADARAALERFRTGLAILEALPAAERGSVPVKRLAASIQRRLADCFWQLEDTKGSLEAYRKAFETLAALAELDPANSRAQFDLAVTLSDAGQVLEAGGDVAGALRHYGQVADILERLLKSDPENISWQAYHAEILVRIGGLLLKTGQREEALRQTARGLAKARGVAGGERTPPGELTRAARLLVVCQPAELRAPQEALRWAERAVQLTGGKDVYALDTLAEAQLQTGRHEEARQTIERGLSLLPAPAGQPTPWLRRMLEAKLARLPRH